MSNPFHKAPDSPETGDVDTESLYGAVPTDSNGEPIDDNAADPESDATETPDPS